MGLRVRSSRFIKFNEAEVMSKKYFRAKEIQEAYGINPSTLSRQRWGQYGLPYSVVGRKPGKKTGGIILYNIDDVEEYLSKNKKNPRY